MKEQVVNNTAVENELDSLLGSVLDGSILQPTVAPVYDDAAEQGVDEFPIDENGAPDEQKPSRTADFPGDEADNDPARESEIISAGSVQNMTPEIVLARIYSLNVMACHYYMASGFNWLEALSVALDEVPAICLCTPGSPVEYSTLEECDEAARSLGYADYETLSDEVAGLMLSSGFLSRFARFTLEFTTKQCFNGTLENVSVSRYLDCVRSEVRNNWAHAKASAICYVKVLTENAPSGTPIVREDEIHGKSVMVGIRNVSEDWDPIEFVATQYEGWKTMNADRNEAERYASDDKATLDHDLMSAVYLQCYIWAGRSWEKATKLFPNLFERCCTLVHASIDDTFKSMADEQSSMARSQRMDELAEQLKDENGNIRLNQLKAGLPTVENLDKPSAEFFVLMKEQETDMNNDAINRTIGSILQAMSPLGGTILSQFIDDIIDTTYERSGGYNLREQLSALDAIREQGMKDIESKSKNWKSKWKKTIGKNPYLAMKAKLGYAIESMDADGNVRFLEAPGDEETDDDETAE